MAVENCWVLLRGNSGRSLVAAESHETSGMSL